MTRVVSSVMLAAVLSAGMPASAKIKPLSLTEGKVLKDLKRYRLRDFHLKKKVRYFDLRQYYDKKGYPYMRGWAFDQGTYNKLPSNLRNILHRLDASKTRNKKGWQWIGYTGVVGADSMFRRYGQPYPRTISILYYAKMDSNMYIYHQNSEKWMKDFLGEIDRPAELALVLHTYKGVKRYKKISKGYQVRIDNLITEKNTPDGRCMHLVRNAIVNKKGEIDSLENSAGYAGYKNEGPLDKKKCDRLRKEIGVR